MDVQELQNRIAAIVDQSSTAPTAGSSSWNLRLKYLNMAQREWEEAYDWSTLYKEYNTLTSNSSGGPTISMPSDFRKLAGYPKITADGSNTDEYPEIDPQTKEQYLSTDEYCYVLGNDKDGYSLIINPATPVSGASIFIPYWAAAASLASPADVSMCPDPNYLVQRSVAQLWEARGDPRFPQAKSEAEKLLQRMVEQENTRGYGYHNEVKHAEDKKSFRWGRD